ncbi:MAG: metallophosphoesterase [Synechococcales cyanobacterium K44_A2020_017]|mgnify:CR=1 FL=1|nr:metallophosphoesterase [Synechococcales cyanobacterium K32_A2020_035]MBF2096708.1 metallophosphoesterase [Synechococcales cyanobacterium K44_A2020_017]
MPLSVRFAIASDLHIGLPHTILDHPNRFHLVEVSIPSLEVVLDHFSSLDLDFLLLPGDLTQHGEPENHAWLAQRLAQLPYPVYVIPGNHDLISTQRSDRSIAASDFPKIYRQFGYQNTDKLYYSHLLAPGLRLIGLNSIAFDEDGQQRSLGDLDDQQLQWLETTLAQTHNELVMVMIHHNVVEHLPGQRHHVLGQRYMLDHAPRLQQILRAAGVQLVFTGHLHVQDIAQQDGLYDITTGSLVSYPHPYRILELQQETQGYRLHIRSHTVQAVPGYPNLQQMSREWMGDRSFSFMMKLLTHPPLNLPVNQAQALAPHLRYFWADIAQGDAHIQLSMLEEPLLRQHFEQFSALDAHGNYAPIDNHTTLLLQERLASAGR